MNKVCLTCPRAALRTVDLRLREDLFLAALFRAGFFAMRLFPTLFLFATEGVGLNECFTFLEDFTGDIFLFFFDTVISLFIFIGSSEADHSLPTFNLDMRNAYLYNGHNK
jgi:hypothetical protein